MDESERAAFETLKMVRWGDNAEAICPYCASLKTYHISRGNVERCAACRHEFTVTTRTAFEGSKLTYRQMLDAMLLDMETYGHYRTAELARLIGVTWKTAHVLRAKMTEAFDWSEPMLSGKPTCGVGYYQGKPLVPQGTDRFVRMKIYQRRLFHLNCTN